MADDKKNRCGKPPAKYKKFGCKSYLSTRRIQEISGRPEEETFFSPVDIYENGDYIFIDMEIPGIEPENISVTFNIDTITIKGCRREAPPPHDSSFYCAERNFGPFKRAFVLGYTVDCAKISSSVRNGLLHISIPKVKNRRKEIHRIQVKTDD